MILFRWRWQANTLRAVRPDAARFLHRLVVQVVGSGTAVAEVACARKVGEYAHFRKVVGGGFGTCAGFRFTACYGGGETNLPGGHKAFVLAVAPAHRVHSSGIRMYAPFILLVIFIACFFY